MKSLTRRMTTLAATGALAVAVFSGCSLINSAVDCVAVGDTMAEIVDRVGGNSKDLRESTAKLRDQAKDIENADLKQSAEDFADEAENVNDAANGDIAGGADTNASKLQDSADKFVNSCNAL